MPPQIPFIDEKTVKSQIDRLIPLIMAVDRFVPGSIELNSVLNVLVVLADDDNFRIPVINLVNQISGAGPV